ncbi:hypothetical protein EHS89_19555 [Amphritea balenae]|uniref:Uncharacterized protein n=1 Tax=Amphritea balenae TaxID=452629 RepID=A0A3P1SIR4_9GAMM|nr:hypothetical protein EHS89_19555 [Amphritea balenae]
MAGFFVINPLDFWAQFVVSEIIGYLSSQPKEGLLMVIKVFREVKSYVKHLVESVIISWEVHLPYRLSLLMIW